MVIPGFLKHQPIEDVIQDAARMVELVEGWMKSQANTSCECSKRSSVESVSFDDFESTWRSEMFNKKM